MLTCQLSVVSCQLPLSACITKTREFGYGCDHALESFSWPLMRRYAEAHRFGSLVTYADGVKLNLVFDDYADAIFAWRYPDEKVEEARVLLKFQLAQRRIKDVLEMPDPDAARIIRSIKDNNWQVSGKLVREYPQLEDQLLALRTVEAVQSAFEGREPAPIIG